MASVKQYCGNEFVILYLRTEPTLVDAAVTAGRRQSFQFVIKSSFSVVRRPWKPGRGLCLKSIMPTKPTGFVPPDPAGLHGNIGNRQSSPVPDTCPSTSTTDACQPTVKPADIGNPASSEYTAIRRPVWAHHPSLCHAVALKAIRQRSVTQATICINYRTEAGSFGITSDWLRLYSVDNGQGATSVLAVFHLCDEIQFYAAAK